MSEATGDKTPLLRLDAISKHFGAIEALRGVSFDVNRGEVVALLGDNGAGKSTLIKTLSGVYQADEGEYLFEGEPMDFRSPRDALERGIATVYQDLAMIPLLSIWRNFFLGSEPTKGWGPWRRFDVDFAQQTARLQVFQLPTYSPDYNPIEKLWKKIKQQDTHLHYFPTFEALTAKVEQALLKFANIPEEILTLCSLPTELAQAA